MVWLRLHTDIINKPKIQRLPGDLFKTLINLWCIAKENGGVLPPVEDIAFALRCSASDIETALRALQERKLIDRKRDGSLQPHEWDQHQYVSDSSTKRVQKYREKQGEAVPRNGDETFHETPPETETEQKQSRAESPRDALDREFAEQFWPAYPVKKSRGQAERAFRTARKSVDLPTILVALERQKPTWSDPRFIKHAGTWLNGKCWEDDAPAATPPAPSREDVQSGRLETYRKTGFWKADWGPKPDSEAA